MSDSNTPHSTPGLTRCLMALLYRLVPVPPDTGSKEFPEAAYLRSASGELADLAIELWPGTIRAALVDMDKKSTDPEDEDLAVHEQALASLARSQGLTPAEILVLILLFQVEVDAMLGRCIALLQHPLGGSRPSLSLAAALLEPVVSAVWEGQDTPPMVPCIAGSRAVDLGVICILNPEAPLPEQVLKMPAHLAICLSGAAMTWPGASLNLFHDEVPLPASILNQARSLGRSLVSGPDNALVLRSASPAESGAAARVIAASAGFAPLFIHHPEKALPALGPVCREKGVMPVFRFESGPGDRTLLPRIQGYDGPVLVMAGLDGAVENSSGSLAHWAIPKPLPGERQQLWEQLLGESGLAERLARDHVHGTARIVELAGLARREAIGRQKARPGMEEIQWAAVQGQSGRLSSLAQPVTARVPDNALVLGGVTQGQLDRLVQRCRAREALDRNLGVTLKARYHMGVKALFTGPSGTGKTLAAGWLSHCLGLPLFRVDLAAVSSKYIGETEKNLSRLLGLAEQDEVVLLFDEADSIFGKRTDIKDANDRFANAQTNYLLQRIETYDGVVILTSNSKARFDSAFIRRLDAMVEFALPGPVERKAIWDRHLGKGHSLTRDQVNVLAVQCTLTGGHIRNAVLTAAVTAKGENRKIEIKDMVPALGDEYRKLGKQLGPEVTRLLPEG